MKSIPAATLALLLAIPALAVPPTGPKRPGGAAKAEPSARREAAGPHQADSGCEPGGSGLVAVIDPETGQLRPPTSAEMKVLLAGRVPPSSGREPLVVVHADGSMTAYLDERFWSNVVVRQRPDGKAEELCVTGPTLPAAPPASARYEEK